MKLEKRLSSTFLRTAALPFPKFLFLLFLVYCANAAIAKNGQKLQKSFLGKLSFMLMWCTVIENKNVS